MKGTTKHALAQNLRITAHRIPVHEGLAAFSVLDGPTAASEPGPDTQGRRH